LAEANEQLRINDKLQKEFINVAAHELRTPIQPILGASEIIEEQFSMKGLQKIEITKPEIDLIQRNAKRLERLSFALLEVARIESRSLKLDRKAFDLNEKITNVITDTKTTFDSRYDSKGGLRILFEPRISPIMVYGDEERLTEVILNLVNNAIKFNRGGPVIVISEIRDGQALVSVKDSGDGIDPEIYPKLFTKFVTKSDIGTGLGLYISKNIIEAHGGRIWGENNREGKGATFTFTIPAKKC
jgi:signal transduction histidine kinase